MRDALRLVEPAATLDLEGINQELSQAAPEAVVEWGLRSFGDDMIVTSSFGSESALMLHLVTRVVPKVRVVFIDTGYLFPETYRFAEQLRERFDLDLRVYSPTLTAARLEALHGRLWDGDDEQLELYGRITKVEPMDRALRELAPRAWIAGLRGVQTSFRASLKPVVLQGGVYKLSPILSWTPEDVQAYMSKHDLPYHPMYHKGYRSIGDHHSTFPTLEGEDARAGRRLSSHRECGIHLPRTRGENASLKSSGL